MRVAELSAGFPGAVLGLGEVSLWWVICFYVLLFGLTFFGGRLHVLASGPRGAVLLLEWGDFRAPLPVGVDFETLERLQTDPELGQVTALLLAESGYAPTNPPGWIAKLRPKVALLSVAAGDRQGRNEPETLQALEGYTLLRTDRNGWIALITDGEQFWAEVERKEVRR